jgi:hypothetical protein
VVCLAPRAPGDSVRPRRLAALLVRPLNFTVRTPMRSVLPLVYLGAPALAVIGVSCWGTRILFREPDVPRLQRFAQLALIWVVPFLGALLVAELYRPSRRRRFRASLNAEEINPTLNQALQPLADGANRAAERFIEQEVFDVVVGHVGHDPGGDGSH